MALFEPKLECIGQINGVYIYYDPYLEKKDEIIINRKDKCICQLIGSSKYLTDYTPFLRKIDKKYNRQLIFEELLIDDSNSMMNYKQMILERNIKYNDRKIQK